MERWTEEENRKVIQANRECGINLHSTQIKAYHTFKESEDSMIFNQNVISDDEESDGKRIQGNQVGKKA